ncbi:hypothetical protein FSP39_002842 [Pinctada imbricata]|uniref:Uncharacterized protein n=1 Tax=Pinctada imbricata TaxID=66713 RepID=A0AA89BJV8_PINIB|nr:hypothetical protein FSP39_002842 [Pinctada imbricata]
MNTCIKDVQLEVEKIIEYARIFEKKMVDEISNKRDLNVKTFERLRNLLIQSDETYEQTIDEIDLKLQTLCSNDIADFMKNAEKTLCELSVPCVEEKVETLSLSEDGDRNGILKKCIGSLIQESVPVKIGIEPSLDFVDAKNPKPIAELVVIRTFEPSWGEPVWSVSIAKDGKAWVGTADKLLRLMDVSGKEHLKVRMDHTPLFTMTTPDDDVIVTHALKSTKIHRVTTSGKVSLYADIAPFNAFGVIVTEGGNVLACTTNRKLMKFFHHGDVMQDIEIDVDPYQITLTNRGRYLVRGGDILLTIHGIADPIELQPEWKIDPIECDRYGHIVCGSRQTGSGIYILNQYGLLLQQFPLNDHVYDIAIDETDQLWIATRSGKIIIAKYLDNGE